MSHHRDCTYSARLCPLPGSCARPGFDLQRSLIRGGPAAAGHFRSPRHPLGVRPGQGLVISDTMTAPEMRGRSRFILLFAALARPGYILCACTLHDVVYMRTVAGRRPRSTMLQAGKSPLYTVGRGPWVCTPVQYTAVQYWAPRLCTGVQRGGLHRLAVSCFTTPHPASCRGTGSRRRARPPECPGRPPGQCRHAPQGRSR